jgi:hypothetical protein
MHNAQCIIAAQLLLVGSVGVVGSVGSVGGSAETPNSYLLTPN